VSYATDDGWYMDLPVAGERSVTDVVIRGSLVFFNTMIPDADPCNYGGTSWLMVADWIDGSAPDVVSFDVNRDSVLNDDDKVGGASAAGISIVGISTSPVNLGRKRYTSTTETTGSASIEVTDILDTGGKKTGRLSWEELN